MVMPEMKVSVPNATDSGTTRIPRSSTRSRGRSAVESVTTATPPTSTSEHRPLRRSARGGRDPNGARRRPDRRAARTRRSAPPTSSGASRCRKWPTSVEHLDPRGGVRQDARRRVRPTRHRRTRRRDRAAAGAAGVGGPRAGCSARPSRVRRGETRGSSSAPPSATPGTAKVARSGSRSAGSGV